MTILGLYQELALQTTHRHPLLISARSVPLLNLISQVGLVDGQIEGRRQLVL